MRYHEILIEAKRMDSLAKLLTPELIGLRQLQSNGFDLRLVGGCVRDILNNVTPKDIDLCTDATPDQQVEVYEKALFGHVPHDQGSAGNYILTGFDHGTITVIPGSDPKSLERYEITSLRTETDHDGRHAKVAYTHDWEGDLARRDLTINAMALTFDGELIDPFNGQDDLKNGIVRFVGDPRERMREDYLRILRFIRFDARFNHTGKVDPKTAYAIHAMAPGMAKLSGERIWLEIQKILVGPYAPRQVKLMIDLDIARSIGLPSGGEQSFARAYALTKNPVTLLSTLFPDGAGATAIVDRWKLNNTERNLLIFLLMHRRDENLEVLAVNGASPEVLAELAKSRGDATAASRILNWTVPTFPVTGKDLIAKGYAAGPEMGKMLARLKQQWIASGFKASKDDLLTTLGIKDTP